jgi:hypothetical protein
MLILALPSVAQAQELPRFDVQAHCRQVAAFGGAMSQSLLGSCVDMEQSAYDGLKPTWHQLPDAARSHCLMVARFGGPGSYSLLQSCLQMETAAGRQNQQRQFRY